MPPKVNPHWEGRVKSQKASHPDWGAGRIANAIWAEKLPEDENVGVRPSARWVGSILASVNDDQLREYRKLHWPESFQRGDLPWEASAAALELLMFLDSNGVRERPPIRLVMWYWRVIQAVRDMSRAVSFSIAAELTRQEGNGQAPRNPGAEWLMAYHHIGRSEDDDDPLAERKRRYREAKDREDSPIPHYVRAGLSINMAEETDPVFWIELGLVSMGWKRTPPRQRDEENNRLIAEYKSQAINLRLSTTEDPESQAVIDSVKEE